MRPRRIEIHLPEGSTKQESGWDGLGKGGQKFALESSSIRSITVDGIEIEIPKQPRETDNDG